MELEGLICCGCGIKIQSEEDKPGYVPSNLTKEHLLCQRCYRIQHYGQVTFVSGQEVYIDQLVDKIVKPGLFVLIVDFFDLQGSLITNLHKLIGNRELLVVVNKVDLLPQHLKITKIKAAVMDAITKIGLKPTAILFCSARTGEGINAVVGAIEKNRHRLNVYVLGTTNVGKSTFMNRLLKNFGGERENLITTSCHSGTTLDFIPISLGDGTFLFDTPGIMRAVSYINWLEVKELKMVVPLESIRPRSYQLNAQQTLFIAGLARIDFIEGDRQTFLCFLSNRLYIHRSKLENSDQFQEMHYGTLLSPPTSRDRLPPFQKKQIMLHKENDKQDILLPGLGWITCSKADALIELSVPKGIELVLRQSVT